MQPLIHSDSLVERVIINLKRKRHEILESFVTVPNVDPLQYGIKLGQIKQIDETLASLVSLEKGIEE